LIDLKTLVIIPTYNEKENIEAIIDAVMEQPITVDLLIVDDGSPDGTASLVKGKQSIYSDRLFIEERSGKLGLGTAYIHGFKWGLERDYELICEMDADFSHDPKSLNDLHKACVDGADVAIGSRYSQGVNVVNWPMSRVLMSYYASKYVQFITGMNVKDATAGFKCYRRSVLEVINFDKINFIGYAFQIEMKFKAWKHGFKLVEVPIIFTDRTKGESKMSTAIFKEAFIGVIQLRLKAIFGTLLK
jgi:dolichol-phosphate mannosyltransferase